MKASEAIEILKGDFSKVTLNENESHSDKFSEAFNMAIEALEYKRCDYDCKNCWKFKLIKPHWIPCSERLPEVCDSVLFTAQNEYFTAVYCGVYEGDGFFSWLQGNYPTTIPNDFIKKARTKCR